MASANHSANIFLSSKISGSSRLSSDHSSCRSAGAGAELEVAAKWVPVEVQQEWLSRLSSDHSSCRSEGAGAGMGRGKWVNGKQGREAG